MQTYLLLVWIRSFIFTIIFDLSIKYGLFINSLYKISGDFVFKYTAMLTALTFTHFPDHPVATIIAQAVFYHKVFAKFVLFEGKRR